MKIVFTCDTMQSGGAERVISLLSNSFSNFGNDVTIIMVSYDKDYSFYHLNKSVKLIPLLKGKSKKIKFFKRAKLLKEAIISEKADVVIAFLSHICIYTWIALRRTGIPFIVSERNDPHQRQLFKQLLLNQAYKKAIGCVFQTTDVLDFYKRIANKKSMVIMNPVLLESITPRIVSPNNVILAVGRLYEQKNYKILLDAFKIFKEKHKDYYLKIYGEGALKKELIDYIELQGISNVIFCGNNLDWKQKEKNSRMYVLSSKYEGMPNALAEALSLGIPSVSTDCPVGGPRELKRIFPKSLLLAKNNDPIDLETKMEECLKIQHSLPFVPEQLNCEYIARQWLDFIKELLK